ncbi:MarR family transcriptional regulator [Nocardiopsis exhalans]|uniref:MarR family transcriptional regulator n=1 Tax=Nocardiopsis exhalans TaxID=163604 RepID=A0ABY5D8R4_9ACTN|nr:helix-turn-helix domain-containing protein [Nocardiopsis exhalans]USY20729.1 MarR family transcriptional regulator [Nocardiopsis exhalans]
MPANTTAPARELILAALAQATKSLTVTELAEEAGVGKSTASKYLPGLEKEGLAVRTPGGRDGRRRLPDHWQAAPTTPTEPAPATAETTSGSAKDLEEAVPAPPATGEAAEDQHPQDTAPAPVSKGETASPTSRSMPAPGHTHQAQRPDTEPASTSTEAAHAPAPRRAAPAPRTKATSGREPVHTGAGEEGVNPVSGSQRLAPGELKLMVWALLKNSPEEEFTATELSHLLQGRSIGAIQNNLAKLSREGKAELACDKPRRYRFASPTA